jgi:hypothetical protein
LGRKADREGISGQNLNRGGECQRRGSTASQAITRASLLLCGDGKIVVRNGTGKSLPACQNGFTTTRMTMPIMSSVGTSLTIR